MAGSQATRTSWLGPVRIAQIAIGLVISALALYLLVRRLELDQVAAALAAAELWLLAPAVAVYFISLTVRAWRWSVLLRPVRPSSWWELFPVTIIGYAGNAILPARLGEVLRVAVLKRRGISALAGLGTVATERVLDGLMAVTTILISSRFLPAVNGANTPQWLRTGLALATTFFVAALAALFVAMAFRAPVSRFLARLAEQRRWAARPAGWGQRFLLGLDVLRRPGLLAAAASITVLGWVISALEYYLVLHAFHLPVGAAGTALLISVVGLSMAVPAAPGSVGTQELAGVTVLEALRIPASAAFGAVVTLHLLEIVPVTLAGLVVLWREGMLMTRRPRGPDAA